MYNAVFDLVISFVEMLKQIGCKNTNYTVEDAKFLKCPVIRSLIHAHGTGIPFVLSEQEYHIVATLIIQKPISLPVEVINVEDAFISLFCHTTTFQMSTKTPPPYSLSCL